MVVKVSPSSASGNNSASQQTAQRVLKKYGLSPSGNGIVKKKASSESSYSKLKNIVPAISEKDNISKLDVVLEAINYIQMLQGNLRASALTSLQLDSSPEESSDYSRHC